MTQDLPSPIPVTLLTGFLGAGKTTLLNRILSEAHGLRAAVLVNDFGAVNVDAELVVGVRGETISLANGCICCSIQGELVDAIRSLIARPERPEQILVEASGVSDPAAIAANFAASGLSHEMRLDGILCVVDAAGFFAAPEQMALKTSQIAMSDLILLNKVDLVDGEGLARIKAWIGRYTTRARCLETTRCAVRLEVLLDRGRPELPGLQVALCHDPACSDPHHDHGQRFVTWSFETDRPLALERLRATIRSLPETVYRAKGICLTAEEPERRAVVQVVGNRGELTFEGGWNGQTPHSRIVAIGRSGDDRAGMDGEELRQRFEACVAG